MKLLGTQTLVLIAFAALLFSYGESKLEKNANSKNFIQSGNEYFPLNDALAVIDNTDPNSTYFSLELSGDKDDLVIFNNLIVDRTTLLPEGNFNFHKATSLQDEQPNMFNDLQLRYGKTGKTVIDAQTKPVEAGTLSIRKMDKGQYQISGTIKSNAMEYQVFYTGAVEHMEAW